MSTQKLRTPIKQQASLDYKLGQIDEKLESNEQAHREITDTLKGISATLIDVRGSISIINTEASGRVAQERQIMTEVSDLCKQILPIQTGIALASNQLITNTERLTALELKTTDIKTEQDRFLGKATVFGAFASAIVAAILWVGKYFMDHLIGK